MRVIVLTHINSSKRINDLTVKCLNNLGYDNIYFPKNKQIHKALAEALGKESNGDRFLVIGSGCLCTGGEKSLMLMSVLKTDNGKFQDVMPYIITKDKLCDILSRCNSEDELKSLLMSELPSISITSYCNHVFVRAVNSTTNVVRLKELLPQMAYVEISEKSIDMVATLIY